MVREMLEVRGVKEVNVIEVKKIMIIEVREVKEMIRNK